MSERRYSRSRTAIVVGTALVIGFSAGLGAPAGARGVEKTAKRINGDRLVKNSVTGKQIRESTLGQVPKAKTATTATKAKTATTATTATNATNLGGLPASAYASAGTATSSGLRDIPASSHPTKTRPIYTRTPLQWSAMCLTGNSGHTFTVTVKATQAAVLATPDGDTSIPAGGSDEFDSIVSATSSINTVPYTVIGADGTSYTGTVVMSFGSKDPCDLLITGIG